MKKNIKSKLYELYKLEAVKKDRKYTPEEEKKYNEIISHFDSKGLDMWKAFQID